MNGTSCPPTITNGQRVTVKIPDGLLDLMMVVAREVLRHAPEDKCTAYSIVADYLEEMIKENNVKIPSCIDNEWTREMITHDVIKTVEKYGVTPESANEAATLIQKAWRKYNKAVSNIKPDSLETGDHVFSKEFRMDTYEEINYENDSDDMERVNVVRKGQRDYVPPIPDFIDDLYSLKYEDEEYNYKRTREMITQDVIKTDVERSVTPESANDALSLIQPDSLETVDRIFSTEIQMDTYEEMNYENDSDDMERVNVVRKGQRDYVPPIPDFIDDVYSKKYEKNVNGQPKETSYEDE
ncbi:uncharacterized protein LOC132934367 [Metopolophium dirhodum]|uniref:uncharacterized protein LOC132934367 n=1 Tax=Metopolophium dirhodum TaxID=44670 RepID=UPI0029906398|nr:uncharacterized protein LOC132934367 [Metopolophium dirhodum]